MTNTKGTILLCLLYLYEVHVSLIRFVPAPQKQLQ
jgi:hypothetical protein